MFYVVRGRPWVHFLSESQRGERSQSQSFTLRCEPVGDLASICKVLDWIPRKEEGREERTPRRSFYKTDMEREPFPRRYFAVGMTREQRQQGLGPALIGREMLAWETRCGAGAKRAWRAESSAARGLAFCTSPPTPSRALQRNCKLLSGI